MAIKKTARRAAAKPAHGDPDADLLALSADHAEPPDMPVAVMLLEAKALSRLADTNAARLAKLGIGRKDVAALDSLAERLTTYEKAWQKRRTGLLRSGSAKQRREKAEELKGELLAAGEWACRKDAAALTELSKIRAGTGLPDTIQDLRDLAEFWSARKDKLARTMLKEADVARGTKLATELESAATNEAADSESAQTYALRNRCFWALNDKASEIRMGGRYAFAKEPKVAAKFTSRHRVEINQRARRAAKKKPTAAPQPA